MNNSSGKFDIVLIFITIHIIIIEQLPAMCTIININITFLLRPIVAEYGMWDQLRVDQ